MVNVESPSPPQKPYRIIQSKQSEHSIVEPDDTLGSGYISGCVLANVSSQGTGSALDVLASDNGKRYLLTEETEWGSTPEKRNKYNNNIYVGGARGETSGGARWFYILVKVVLQNVWKQVTNVLIHLILVH